MNVLEFLRIKVPLTSKCWCSHLGLLLLLLLYIILLFYSIICYALLLTLTYFTHKSLTAWLLISQVTAGWAECVESSVFVPSPLLAPDLTHCLT